MNKKGFTLTELLVVIAIIGVLSLIIIPSVISVNKNINERLYNQKVSNIVASAELYGSNNEEIFNGNEEVRVYVYELINTNYITTDVNTQADNCTSIDNEKGCVIDPRDKTSMNEKYVILRKLNSGITGEFNGESSSTTTNDGTLVEAVCSAFESGSLLGKYSTNTNSTCRCNRSRTGFVDENGNTLNINACIITGENPNNYLKYGSNRANWRVLGIYKLNEGLSAKIITTDTI